jgi:hypothetical protein
VAERSKIDGNENQFYTDLAFERRCKIFAIK